MGETPETPAEGQVPDAPESQEGQEPQDKPQGESKTYDEDYVKQLRSENAKRRIKEQQLEERLEELEGANKSEAEKAQAKATKAEQRAAEAEAKLLRFEVAQEKNVPAKLVPLLTAASREDLEAQADLILENAAQPAPPDFDGGARDPAPEPKTPQQAHDELVVGLFGGKTPN